MDLKQIKELMLAMEEAGVKKLTLKEKNGFELCLERELEQAAPATASMPFHPSFTPNTFHLHRDIEAHHSPQLHKEVTPAKEEVKKEVSGLFVTSPMVGTFYASPSPDNPPFVKVGDMIDENTVVCIIEAMKVMNEVKAGVKGKVAEVLVSSGHPVEFGTKLFRIE